MAYFPFFINIENKNGLIVGGGITALKKIDKLLPYGVKLHIISDSIIKDIKEHEGVKGGKLFISERDFLDEDLTEYLDFVVVACDDEKLCSHISNRCKELKILVNVVDDIENCNFIFPSTIKKGELSIGICTAGASPVVAMELKRDIEKVVPDNIEDILEKMREIRAEMKERYPNEKERAEILSKIYGELR